MDQDDYPGYGDFTMAKFSLYERFLNQGTLSEPEGIPDPRQALPSTVNWMRSLAMVIEDEALDFTKAFAFYSKTQKTRCSEQQENSIFEHLILALHQLSALNAMTKTERQASDLDLSADSAPGKAYLPPNGRKLRPVHQHI